MTSLAGVLKPQVEDVFCRLAYLDIEAREETMPAAAAWQLCAAVDFEGGALLLLVAPDLAAQAADGFTGRATGRAEQEDMVCEMANVLAGHACAAIHGVRKTVRRSVPRLIPAAQAVARWSAASGVRMLLWKTEMDAVGGLMVEVLPAAGGA
jgi:hypothetical protein